MKRVFVTSFIVLILAVSITVSYDLNLNVKAQGIPNPSTQGLMAWWKLDEGVGNTVSDLSGNNYDGTLNGCTWVNSGGITSLSFNGQSDYVSLPSLDLTNLNSLTVVSWINSDLTKVGFIVFHGSLGEITLGNGDLNENDQALNVNSTYASFSVKLSDLNWYWIHSSSSLQPNTWHQITGVWIKGTCLKVYVDGVLAGENDSVANLGLSDPGTGFPNSLGIYSQNQYNNIDFFKGQMSNIMIYDRALTPEEIQTLSDQFEKPLQTPSLTVSCFSATSEQIFNVFNISGDLTSNGTAISDAPVYVSYSVTGGQSWQDLTLVYTDANGTYSALWLPTITGNYQLKAVYEGDENNSGTSSTINFAIEPSTDQNVFSISSNSTITALSFDPDSKELSFNVTGDPGTRGYAYVFIPSALLNDSSDLSVQLDGSPINYTINSQNNGWLLYFEYHHSSHMVVISLGLPYRTTSSNTPNLGDIENYVLLAIFASAAAAMAILLAIYKTETAKSKKQES